MNQEKRVAEKSTETKKTRTQQLQKLWLLSVNIMSHMLCHSGWPRDGDVQAVVV